MKLGNVFGPRHGPALVNIYQRGTRLFVQASDRTVMKIAGFWIGSGPVATLTVTDDAKAIGGAVLEALARSRTEVPVPERGVDLEAPLRQAAGVRSRRALMEGTRLVVLSRNERGELRIEPYHNGGTAGETRGHWPLGDAAAVTLGGDAEPSAVGDAVIAALGRATGPDISGTN